MWCKRERHKKQQGGIKVEYFAGGIFKGATYLSKLRKYLTENDRLSMASLQSCTGLGYVRAGIITDYLKEMGILVESRPFDLVIDKSKICILDAYGR